jgi:hypothetical protein
METYKGYNLQQQGDNDNTWGTAENSVFKQIIDALMAVPVLYAVTDTRARSFVCRYSGNSVIKGCDILITIPHDVNMPAVSVSVGDYASSISYDSRGLSIICGGSVADALAASDGNLEAAGGTLTPYGDTPQVYNTFDNSVTDLTSLDQYHESGSDIQRALSLNYQNTTGRDIYVAVQLTAGGYLQISPDGQTYYTVSDTSGSATSTTVQYPVPAGYYYEVFTNDSASLIAWIEKS